MGRGPIALGYGLQRSKPLNASRIVNLYPELTPEGSRSPIGLYGTPGQKAYLSVGADTIRAGLEVPGYAYILSGAVLYRVDSAGVSTPCTGDLIPNTGHAKLINNETQVGLLVVPFFFVVTGTTIARVLSGIPVEGFSSIDYIDGYAVGTRNDQSGQFYISAQRDFATFDPLDFATAESNPDGLLGVLVDHREMWLFGTDTIEPWTNTGASPFPFERVNGAVLEKGCAAARSPAKVDNSIFWLGSDRIVYRADGYRPVRISTHAIEEILRVGTVSDAYGLTYSQGGHQFYALTLPSLGRTIVYDAAPPNQWHERQSGTSLLPAIWDVQCIFTAFGKTLVGLQAGKVAELDLDTYTDLGAPIRSSIASLPLYADTKRAIMDDLQLGCELGVGLTDGQGSDPEVMMRFSDDGGNTWSNERRASLGKIGMRFIRAMWERLGAFRQRTVEFSISDPVKRVFYDMSSNIRNLGR